MVATMPSGPDDAAPGTGCGHTATVDVHRYSFRSSWVVPADPDAVYRALREVSDYPQWWPQVRDAVRVDDGIFDMVVRSALPYDLRFRSTRSREDPETRVLEAGMTGDLDGFSRWTVTATADGATAVFEEEVVARKLLLRRLALVARPGFVANHAVMMRAGRVGLRAYVAGRRRGDG